ncbi:hypothetical protein MATL_G00196180 [Megalops atlanticus]|uniref:HAUS augmin-like complex subunit 6 N-terminal domain-containing protein n=1 Tax=Megalops atlanticus TaxID=7932 RepID=A0A9D3PPC8_MEGAT|nr:hypothetical protein MATL_G00196180 [Megalops atlanticus]
MSSLQKSNAKYLWWTLLGLGFQPEVASASKGISKANVRHVTLGMTMFDTPNKDAFYIVTHFLLEKLDSARVHEVFRHCWPVLDRKADAEFRKATVTWFRDIAAEPGSSFPKVVPSLFLSPGGPKFINVMLHLAKHVMLQEMKTFSTDNSWIPETAATKAHSVETAMLRFQVVKTRFQRAAVEQDRVVQEYQRRAQALVKSMRELRAEDAKYEALLKGHTEVEKERSLPSEKIQKVRSLWADVNKILSSLEEERKVVDCVVKGHVDQYVLDGTDVTLKIPKTLLEQIESSAYSSSAGNLYEAGQLNLLRLLELLNEALQHLQQEHVQAGEGTLQLDLPQMEEKALQLKRTLEALKLMRKRITKEEIPEVKASIKKMEAAWDSKWADCLRQRPLTSFLNEDPALDFFSPMAPLSFEPAAEVNFKSSIFSQYPAKLPVSPPSPPPHIVASAEEETPAKHPDSSGDSVEKTADLQSPVQQPSEIQVPSSAVSSRPSTPPKTPSPSPVQSSEKETPMVEDVQLEIAEVNKKASILDREFDNLANQFAEAVTNNSTDYSRRGWELDDLLGTLSDPFSTRKQLPRTPDSLISEVKNSWRQAVREGEAEKARLSEKLGDRAAKAHTPLLEGMEALPSGDESPLSSGLVQPITQYRESLHSTLSWHSSQLEATQGQSSGDVIQFGIDFETLPELDNESPLGSSYGPGGHWGRGGRRRTAYDETSFIDCRVKTPEPPPPRNAAKTPEAVGWETGDKVFSLDLAGLESPSLPSTELLSLPKLITFSPMEDFIP